jgi:hypothetical protein
MNLPEGFFILESYLDAEFQPSPGLLRYQDQGGKFIKKSVRKQFGFPGDETALDHRGMKLLESFNLRLFSGSMVP